MAEYIEKGALMRHIESEARRWGFDYDYWQVLADVEDFPVADVRPVVRGRWMPHPDKSYREWDVCSACGTGCKRREYGENDDGTEFVTEYSYHFCPWCMADMKGGDAL